MSKLVTCERCGARIDARGMAGHRRSYACDVGYTRRKYAAQGYVEFDGLRSNSVYLVEGLFKRDVVGFYLAGRYSKAFSYGYYGPKWLYPVWRLAVTVDKIDRKTALDMYHEAISLGRPGPLFDKLYPESDFLQTVAVVDIKRRYKKQVLTLLLDGDLVTAKAMFELLCAARS